MGAVLSEELVEFVESGVSMLIGTRDAKLRPHAMRGFGCAVRSDRMGLSVFLARNVSEQTLADLRESSGIAVTFSRPIDHRCIQLKGRVCSVRDTTPVEHELQARYLAAFAEQLYVVGLPRSLARRMQLFPSSALELELDELFVQTPGPGAGRRMDDMR